jgi:short-subunit dehydrogenase
MFEFKNKNSQIIVNFLFKIKGHTVVITGRSDKSVGKALDQLRKEGYKTAYGKPCHFARVNQVEELRKWIKEKFGRVDVLINNAATSLHFGPILDTTPKAYDKMMNLNVKVHSFFPFTK